MNPDFPQNEREKLEAKLTAFLLGELPPDETIALCKAMEEDRDLAALYERIKLTVGLVRESTGSPATETSRASAAVKTVERPPGKIAHAQFKFVAPKEFAKPTPKISLLVQIAAVFTILALLAGMLLPALGKV